MLKVRKAIKGEAELCYSFIQAARAYHKSLGFEQWHPDYPTLETIQEDIDEGVAYVFTEEGTPLGYCAFVIDEEPAYKNIDGAWKTNKPYAVIHRMAFDTNARGKGLSKGAFSLLKELCKQNRIEAIRVDTQKENALMQHILLREGFEYCGLVTFDGGPKLAYEWDACF